jgi:hypothetical protein
MPQDVTRDGLARRVPLECPLTDTYHMPGVAADVAHAPNSPQVSRETRWERPPDYVEDRAYVMKSATYGMSFYH